MSMPVISSDIINWLRIAVCLAILGYSCVTDWRSRRAPPILWEVMTAAGVILLLVEIFISSYDARYEVLFFFAISFCIIYLLVNFIYYLFNNVLKGAFGGADANALLALSVLFPYYPFMDLLNSSLPLVKFPITPIFTLAVFGNALILNIVLPVSIFLYNVYKVPFAELRANLGTAFFGYKLKIGDLKNKHVRLMHTYEEEDGEVSRRFSMFKYPELDDKLYKQLVKWSKEGKIPDQLWVTPKIPLLIPITLGVIVALAYGDIMTQIIFWVMGLI